MWILLKQQIGLSSNFILKASSSVLPENFVCVSSLTNMKILLCLQDGDAANFFKGQPCSRVPLPASSMTCLTAFFKLFARSIISFGLTAFWEGGFAGSSTSCSLLSHKDSSLEDSTVSSSTMREWMPGRTGVAWESVCKAWSSCSSFSFRTEH